MGCLYKIDFPNGKCYVGITTQSLAARMRGHLSVASNSIVSRGIRKYASKIDARVLVVAADWEYLCELEKRAIVAYGSLHPEGYNMTSGGEGQLNPAGAVREKMSRAAKSRIVSDATRRKMSQSQQGRTHTEAARAKMSLAAKGNKNFAGHKLSEEHRAKLLAVNLGKPKSETVKAKLSLANKGRKHTPEVRAKIAAAGIGRSISEAGRARISAARKEKPLSIEHRAKLSAAHIGQQSGNKGKSWSAATRAKHEARHAAKKANYDRA